MSRSVPACVWFKMNLKRFLPGARPQVAPALADTTDSQFRVGQQWNYRTRPQDAGATLVVVKVEASTKLGTIVHISLSGLKHKNPHHPGGLSETVAHLPFSEAALAQSVTDLVEANAPLPEFVDGYNQWRNAFDAGRAGVFSISVAEAVSGMEAAMGSSG